MAYPTANIPNAYQIVGDAMVQGSTLLDKFNDMVAKKQALKLAQIKAEEEAARQRREVELREQEFTWKQTEAQNKADKEARILKAEKDVRDTLSKGKTEGVQGPMTEDGTRPSVPYTPREQLELGYKLGAIETSKYLEQIQPTTLEKNLEAQKELSLYNSGLRTGESKSRHAQNMELARQRARQAGDLLVKRINITRGAKEKPLTIYDIERGAFDPKKLGQDGINEIVSVYQDVLNNLQEPDIESMDYEAEAREYNKNKNKIEGVIRRLNTSQTILPKETAQPKERKKNSSGDWIVKVNGKWQLE